MAITPLGTLPITAFNPAAVAAVAAFVGSAGVMLPSLQAQLTGALVAQVSIAATPPSLALSLAGALQVVANLTASIVAGVPDISFQATAILDVIAELTAQIAALSIDLTLPTAAIAAYLYEGPANAMATELVPYFASGVAGGGPTDQTTAIVFAAVEPAAKAAMSVMFGTP